MADDLTLYNSLRRRIGHKDIKAISGASGICLRNVCDAYSTWVNEHATTSHGSDWDYQLI
jgi:hypothetical protein